MTSPLQVRRIPWVGIAASALFLGIVWAFFFLDSPPPKDADLLRPPVALPGKGANLKAIERLAFSLPETSFDWKRSIGVQRSNSPSNWDRSYVSSLTTPNEKPISLALGHLGSDPYQLPTFEEDPSQSSCSAINDLLLALCIESLESILTDSDEHRALEHTSTLLRTVSRARSEHDLTGHMMTSFFWLRALEHIEFIGRHTREPASLYRLLSELNQCPPPSDRYRDSLYGEYRRFRASAGNRGRDSLTAAEVEPYRRMTWLEKRSLPAKKNRTLDLIAEIIRSEAKNSRKVYSLHDLTLEDHWGSWSKSWAATHLSENLGGRFTASLLSHQIEYQRQLSLEAAFRIRALRTFIAIRLFHHHHGALPSTTVNLTPRFLPAVPIDPYDGAPIRYSPSSGRIWSVGLDLRDAGGIEERSGRHWKNEPTFHLDFCTHCHSTGGHSPAK